MTFFGWPFSVLTLGVLLGVECTDEGGVTPGEVSSEAPCGWSPLYWRLLHGPGEAEVVLEFGRLGGLNVSLFNAGRLRPRGELFQLFLVEAADQVPLLLFDLEALQRGN